MNAQELIERLMSYYNVFSMQELADKIGISQPAISKWKKTNSVLAIKKKCRELGIYNEIFILNNKGTKNSEDFIDYENLSEHDNYYIQQQKEVEKQISNRHLLTFKEVSEMNATIVSSFINVYKKFAEKGNLKELHKILGELEFD